ncbi:hypothetical protein QU38_00995, partial [Staphylococcus aureus]
MALGQRCQQYLDLVGEAAVPDERREILIRLPDRFDHRRARAGPGDANHVELRRTLGEAGEQALDDHAVLAVEDALAAERGIGEGVLEQEER